MIYFKLHFARKLPVDLIFPAYIASPFPSICTICGHATTCAKRLRRSRITNAIWKLLNGEYYILFVLRVLFGASQFFSVSSKYNLRLQESSSTMWPDDGRRGTSLLRLWSAAWSIRSSCSRRWRTAWADPRPTSRTPPIMGCGGSSLGSFDKCGG